MEWVHCIHIIYAIRDSIYKCLKLLIIYEPNVCEDDDDDVSKDMMLSERAYFKLLRRLAFFLGISRKKILFISVGLVIKCTYATPPPHLHGAHCQKGRNYKILKSAIELVAR